MRYSKEYLQEIVNNSESLWEVVENLNIKRTNGNFTYVSKKIKTLNIDKTHFKSQYGKNVKKIPLEDYLVKDKFLTINGNNFKYKLYKEGVKKPICEICTQGEIWKGNKISLILDHIDGDRENNLLENLRIVCPNCNASLETHCGKNKNRGVEQW